MDHPNFRLRGKVFATLGYPNEKFGMVKLRPQQQQQHSFARANPNSFSTVKGGWGARGATLVDFQNVDESTLLLAITAAY